MHWLVAARDALDTTSSTRALDWVRDHLGTKAFGKCMLLSGPLSHPLSDNNLTMADVLERLRDARFGRDRVPPIRRDGQHVEENLRVSLEFVDLTEDIGRYVPFQYAKQQLTVRGHSERS